MARSRAIALTALMGISALVATLVFAQNPGGTREFISNMSRASAAEIELGRWAASQSQHAGVRTFANMLVKDHTQSNAELLRIATDLNVTPAKDLDEKHKALSAKLSSLQGLAFDRAYIDAMVDGHEGVEAMLRDRAGVTPPPSAETTVSGTVQLDTSAAGELALTEWAARALPVVQQHLARARELQKSLKSAR